MIKYFCDKCKAECTSKQDDLPTIARLTNDGEISCSDCWSPPKAEVILDRSHMDNKSVHGKGKNYGIQ